MAIPGRPAPAVPEGWQVSWSDQYNQWFYVQSATGVSQWHHPSGQAYGGQPSVTQQAAYYAPAQPQYNGQPAATVQPAYYAPTQPQYGGQPAATVQPNSYPPPQPQYGQQAFAPPPIAGQQAAPTKTGILGKLSNLDPKAQTALAVGGGLAAGALLEHEIDEFKDKPHFPHHGGGHYHIFGTMAGLIGAAGAGALGTKLLGGMGQSAQAAPPPPASQPYLGTQAGAPAYPAQTPPPPAYANQPVPPPGAPSSSPGMGGLGKLAMGGAAGMAAGALAVGGASSMLHHYHDQGGAPTAAGGGGGAMSSFLGGITHSGPRLIIHAAAYADKDVTDRVKALVTPDQVLSIGNLNDEFGDPWPEAKRKMFSVLYQYGDRPLEVWAGSTSNEKVDIRHEALANLRMSYINKDPGRIICLIWGDQSILSKERVEKLETDGELDCSGLGVGGFYGWEARNLICYYRASNGGVGIGHGREGGTMRLPWNPLAKWS